jgi:hypothetical protein
MFLFKPDEEVRQIIGVAIGRAQKKYPVKIYWIVFNINHKHIATAPLSDDPEHIKNVARFHQLFNSLVSRGVNKRYKREGALYSSRNRTSEATDDQSLEKQLFYSITNPVKDGLVEETAQWKQYSSYEQLATGKVEKFRYIDWTAWHKAGGKKKGLSPDDFAEEVEVELSPIPAWEGMEAHEREAHFRREIQKLEQEFKELREKEGKQVIGPTELEKIDPRTRPETEKEKTRKPLCHSSTKEGADNYREKLKAFLEKYYYASSQWLAGNHEVEFPRGSFKPPDIRAAVSCVHT